MNIIRLVSRLPPIDKVAGLPGIVDISRGQVSLGHRVFVICRHLRGQRISEQIDGVNIRRVDTPFNFHALREISRLKKKYHFRIVHTHATACPHFSLYKHLLDGSDLKHIAHVHGTTKGILDSWRRLGCSEQKSLQEQLSDTLATLREAFVWRSADGVIAVSDSVKSELVKLYGISEERIHVVNNGVDLNLFRSFGDRKSLLRSLGFKPDTDLVLYLGWFRAIKGPDILVKALDIVRRGCPKVKALIVSGKIDYAKNGYARKLLALIHKLGLEEIIQIRETIPHHTLPEVYNAARVVVVPSIHESFPKVPLEAMACGTPVIASSVGGLAEILGGGAGVLVKPRDPVELSAQIIDIISNPSWAKEIGELSRRRALERFAWRNTVTQIMDVYGKVLGGVD